MTSWKALSICAIWGSVAASAVMQYDLTTTISMMALIATFLVVVTD